MITLLRKNLYMGTIFDLSETNEDEWAYIHATQTMHYNILGWDKNKFSPDKKHPDYYIYEKNNHLSLNWIAGRTEIGGVETFVKILDFISKWIKIRKVFVHCDKGHSRSPAICMLYLSKRMNLFPKNSYASAKTEFIKLYPEYKSSSIGEKIRRNWNKIV